MAPSTPVAKCTSAAPAADGDVDAARVEEEPAEESPVVREDDEDDKGGVDDEGLDGSMVIAE